GGQGSGETTGQGDKEAGQGDKETKGQGDERRPAPGSPATPSARFRRGGGRCSARHPRRRRAAGRERDGHPRWSNGRGAAAGRSPARTLLLQDLALTGDPRGRLTLFLEVLRPSFEAPLSREDIEMVADALAFEEGALDRIVRDLLTVAGMGVDPMPRLRDAF